jgi:hypothetical protein
MLLLFFLIVVVENGDGIRLQQSRTSEGRKCCCNSLAMEHVSRFLENQQSFPPPHNSVSILLLRFFSKQIEGSTKENKDS